eukprot:3821748-Pleurochrysis_carterae.AAC.3
MVKYVANLHGRMLLHNFCTRFNCKGQHRPSRGRCMAKPNPWLARGQSLTAHSRRKGRQSELRQSASSQLALEPSPAQTLCDLLSPCVALSKPRKGWRACAHASAAGRARARQLICVGGRVRLTALGKDTRCCC